MKQNRCLIVLLCLCATLANAQVRLKISPGTKTIGYQVLCNAGTDADHNAKVNTWYRIGNQPGWRSVLSPDYNYLSGAAYFAGIVVPEFTKTGDKIHIKIAFTDSFPTLISQTLEDSVSLLQVPDVPAATKQFWVSPDGSGTAYTNAQPGSLKTLLESGMVTCGNTVLLKTGVYFTGEIIMNLNQNCNAASPVVIQSEPGGAAVLDGADTGTYVWKKWGTDTTVYYATIKPSLEYNQLCLMDGIRLYPYAFLTPNSVFPAYPCLTNLGYEQDGFYRLGNQVYLKTKHNTNPNQKPPLFSAKFFCISVYGNGKQNYLYFRNLKFRNYAKGKTDKDIFSNPSVSYPGYAISLNQVSHSLFQNCQFEYSNTCITFNGKCNDNLVHQCSFVDGLGGWSHGAFKQTRDQSVLDYGSYGRYLEFAAIIFSPGDSFCERNVVDSCTATGYVAGLVTEITSSKGGISETEMACNNVWHCYNGLNADGISVNSRIFGNEVRDCQVGISLIIAEQGPDFLLRNVVHQIKGKKNHNDIFFLDCENHSSNQIWGTGLKLNASPRTSNPPVLHLYHNVFQGVDSLGFAMYLWPATWKQLKLANNIYAANGISTFFFDGIQKDSLFRFQSQHDHYQHEQGRIATIQPINGQPSCILVTAAGDLQTQLRSVTGVYSISVDSGATGNVGFVNESGGDFHLSQGSAGIDWGIHIPGFDDGYFGTAPDVGSFETISAGVFHPHIEPILLFPNPANGRFAIASGQQLTGLPKAFDCFGREHVCVQENDGTYSLPFSAAGVYLIQVPTRVGTGIARLLWAPVAE